MNSPVKSVLAPKAPGDAYLSAAGLDIGYAHDVVVPDINFSLKRGEAIALIGTNGCGKSTLLKTIVGLLPLLKGNLSVFEMPPGQNRQRIAYLGQFHHSGFVLPIRAADVVRMGRFPLYGLWKRIPKNDDEIIFTALRAMGIEKLADTPLRSLSGGQQQRTYIAQVLAHRADLLVLDEPTSGLDAGGRELYLRAMENELRRGASIVTATHDIQDEAKLCQQVMLLARKVIALGKPRDVLNPDALLKTFGIVVTGDKRIQVLETHHGHSGTEHQDINQEKH
jgi:ABC-type Mn2+/Zn2+ transport system ATPase subunit